MKAALVGLVLAAGCYSPHIGDCAYTCQTDQQCPDGLSCDTAQHACRVAGATGACGTPSGDARSDTNGPANGDGPRSDGSPGFPFTPTNYTPEELAAVPTGNGTFGDGPVSFDGASFATKISHGGASMLLVHLASLSIGPETSVEIDGALPVILAVDGDVEIDGELSGAAGAVMCSGGAGRPGAGCTSGGAGGSFAGLGGAGGSCSGGAAGMPVPSPVVSLIPLRGGCSGGSGGIAASPNPTGGVPGIGGGGVEISARGTIVITGGISVGGGGGGPGQLDLSVPTLAGGGGGGAGGGLLLESPGISFPVGAFLCAAGGGGGGAMYDNPTGGIALGTPGQPGCAGGTGGAGGTSHPDGSGSGATGGGAPGAMASNGGLGTAGGTEAGGGGGGGSTGAIVIRTSTTVMGNIVPAPTFEPL